MHPRISKLTLWKPNFVMCNFFPFSYPQRFKCPSETENFIIYLRPIRLILSAKPAQDGRVLQKLLSLRGRPLK